MKDCLQIEEKKYTESNSFNALRFFFCIIVIVGHCLDISQTRFTYRKLIDMHISVCAFFILSGYWVTKSYLKNKNVKKFLIKRAFRILPLYYSTVFIFAFILVFFSSLSACEYFSSFKFWKYLFWNTLTLNFVCPSLPGLFGGYAVNGALWTIKVEIGFYLILPLVVFILDKLSSVRKRNAFLIGIYLFSVLYHFLLSKYASKLGISSKIANQLPGYMSFFISGVIFIYNKDFFEQKLRLLIIPAIIIFVLHYITKTEVLLPFVLAIIIMFFGSRLYFLSEVGQPVDYSYGMYLFHFPLINIFTYLGFFQKAPFFCIVIIIATVLAFSFLAEKYIQSKINKLIH